MVWLSKKIVIKNSSLCLSDVVLTMTLNATFTQSDKNPEKYKMVFKNEIKEGDRIEVETEDFECLKADWGG